MIRIAYLNNSIGNKNLLLEVDEIHLREIADSYYFALDNSFMPEEESDTKVILNLRKLLEAWQDKLKTIRNGEEILLPFDFSDEYIGGLRIKGLEEEKIQVDYGFTTKFTGASINPSESLLRTLINEKFKSTSSFFVTMKENLINQITSSLANLNMP